MPGGDLDTVCQRNAGYGALEENVFELYKVNPDYA